MLYLRPQRVYKPSTYTLFDPNEFVLDLTNATYRLRIETPRGTSITEDNSQITCYAHIFLKKDGSQLTERLKERGFRPTWLLDNKPIDSARVSEDGYKLTFETSHLPAILQTVTLQARDTDILLALTDDPMIRRLLQTAIDSGFRPSALIETSEQLLDACSWDKLINQLKQDLTASVKANTDTLSELLKHPLTVSKDGYWRIWDALKKTYVTTEYQSRGRQGEAGHSPSPEEVLSTARFKDLLGTEVTTQVAPVSKRIDEVKTTAEQSARDAITEAVKRAGEMDKQIKVGGRNLIKSLRCLGDSITSYREVKVDGDALLWKQLNDGTQPYSLVLHAPLTDGDYTLSYKCSVGENYRDYIYYYRADNGDGFSNRTTTTTTTTTKLSDGVWLHTATFRGLVASKYTYIYFYGTEPFDPAKEVRFWDIKLERGTIATDWTPAPEDVAESVTSLASTLLDPEQGEIHKLTSLLESHKIATDKSFEELATHPLTVDEAGFWQIWSVKDGEYKTTQYKSRGDKGEDAGRYLGRAKRIHPDLIGNYLPETEGSSWQTAKEGDYVYLVGDAPNRGGDKDTYYIVREHTSKTDWAVYDIKGHTPRLTLDEQYRLVADGKLVSQQSLKGRDGEDGHSPSADEVLKTDDFKKMLGGEVTQRVKPVRDDLDNAKIDFGQGLQQTSQALSDLSKHFGDELSTATTNITNLQKVALTQQQRQDLGLLTSALRLKMAGGEGDKKTLEGLTLLKYIALSGDNKTVSAYLASDALDAVLKAGVTDFGTDNEREQVCINHNGTGHLGNLHFAGNQIDFRTDESAEPYLSMGAEENQFITDFLGTARLDDTPVTVGTVTLSEQSTSYERTLSVDNDGTRLTVVIDQLEVSLYNSAKTRLLLDGEELGSWQGVVEITEGGGGAFNGVPDFREEWVPYKGSNLSYERVVKAGSHTLRLEIAGKMGAGDSGATIKGLRIKRRYDTGRQQSAFAKNGLRLFGSPDRYFDVDYRKSYRERIGPSNYFTVPNPYLVRIVGGAKIDKLTVDELDMPGVPLCGATFDAYGTKIKAFGKYVNQRGTNKVQAEYDRGLGAFKVYHSIGNTKYIPIVQVSGWNSGDTNWSLTPRVYDIKSDYFVVRILSNNDNPHNKGFSYVAYKTM